MGCRVAVFLGVRAQRQAVLAQAAPEWFWVILDEAVIRRTIGTAEVMRGQWRRLVDAARLPSVRIQVLPLRAIANPAPPTNFTIVEFADESERDVVYIELLTGGIHLEGGDSRGYAAVFDSVVDAALGPAESIELIGDIESGFGGEGR